jgi:NDP-sugar pyrophosphorylase family protein
MDAMILAAGLGTRLRPLTNDLPKALVPVGDRPMLEHVARRLLAAGATRLVVNVHHHADQIKRFLDARGGFGVEVFVSEEPEERLETGGGLKHAERFFTKDAPFFIHNADVFTDIDLRALYAAHTASGALATLACRPAETPRHLVFDDGGLCGYGLAGGREHLIREPEGGPERLDFCGIHVLSPEIFDRMTETGVFSIITTYLRLSREGARILPYRADGATWIDIGSFERLEEARVRFG